MQRVLGSIATTDTKLKNKNKTYMRFDTKKKETVPVTLSI
jgi:hypothetical protein